MNELIFYNAARQALQQAASVDEVKEVKDKAEAIRLYAQQQNDDTLERYASQIKTRAMRRLGELSSELETSPGVRTDIIPETEEPCSTSGTRLKEPRTKSQVLESAGISRTQAHRREKLAEIPEEIFEKAKELGADESGEKFERALRRIVPPNESRKSDKQNQP
jgi:hypothetical protein